MYSEFEKECYICQQKGLCSKCSACIISFKKMEIKLKERLLALKSCSK